MINRLLNAIRASFSGKGLMDLGIAIGTIAVVNKVPQLRKIVKG